MATSASTSKIKSVAAWGFGIVFGIVGLSSLGSHPVRGVMLLLAAAVLIPPLSRMIGQKAVALSRTSSKVIVGILAFIVAVSLMPNPPVQEGTTPVPTQAAQPVAPSYEIVKRWTIPNGGEGKLIVIAPENANEADIIALGEKLKQDTAGERHVSIMVYTDRKAADLYSKLPDGLSKEDNDFYNTHMVAGYDRNIVTGYHRLSVFPAGVESEWKEIDY